MHSTRNIILSDLPDEILNLISIRLNGFDNCFLWMASDSKLKQRLLNSVITDFDIEYTVPGRYLWPGSFLKKLSNLSRLSLVANDEDVFHIPFENIEMFAMPTLKYLKLCFDNYYQIFYQKRLISSNDPTGPTISLINNYINLNDFYPNLEHLKIIGPSPKRNLMINFFGCLPQNLKSLLIPGIFIDIDTKNNQSGSLNANIELLPRTLTEIEAVFDYQSDDIAYLDLSKLPPNLTSLDMNVHLDIQTYHVIPQSLTKLMMNRSNADDKILPFLPTGLEKLKLAFDGNPAAGQILTHFQNLQDVSVHLTSQIRFDNFLINCPPKLKTFSCSNLDLTGFVAPSSLFSDCLTTFKLINAVGISAEFIAALPQSLTDLILDEVEPEPGFAFLSLLPRKLQSLMINLNIVENTSLLPNSLISLDMTTTEPFDASHLDRLPPKLEILAIEVNLSSPLMKHLPTNLTNLYLISIQIVGDELVRMLPKGLKRFSLVSQDEITDEGIADLPTCLESLVLHYNTEMTDYGISLLPRSLTCLILSQNKNFTDECIKHLPRNLTDIHFDQATKITSKSCKDLPRYLQSLCLPKCANWDPEMLIASKNELPVFMREIDLGNRDARKTWRKIVAECYKNRYSDYP